MWWNIIYNPTFWAVDARPEVVANAGAALQIIGSMVVTPRKTLVDLLVELGAINSLPTCLAVTATGNTRTVIGARRVRTLNCNTKAHFIMHKPLRDQLDYTHWELRLTLRVSRARSLAINLVFFIYARENYYNRRQMFFYHSFTRNTSRELFPYTGILSPLLVTCGNKRIFYSTLNVLSIWTSHTDFLITKRWDNKAAWIKPAERIFLSACDFKIPHSSKSLPLGSILSSTSGVWTSKKHISISRC